jgi:hypothetical protein
MTRQDRNQHFLNGVLQSEQVVTIPDAQIEREDAPLRLRQSVVGLRIWSTEAQANFDTWGAKTAAQKDAANRELHRRFGILCDRLKDLLIAQAMD